ncbi:SH3-domain-containing protein [Scleroderma citrinum]
MAVPSNVQATALLAHIASQMQLNVAFLESQNYLSAQDAATMRGIIQRLPVNTTTDIKVAPPVRTSVQDVEKKQVDIPAVYARAVWAYNENGAEPNDLAFAAGDTIEIVAETNQDWWLGRVHGREGLFPANYVEKIHDPPNRLAGATAPPEKKNKLLDKYGNTMAQSAAGGLGFGAGAAIGGGLVRAIF